MRDVRQAQDRNAFVSARLDAQLDERTVTDPRRRIYGGPLLLPASPAAPPNTMAAQRLLLQSTIVARELAIGKRPATDGAIT